MGFFPQNQRMRLLREQWPNATQLAEELFAMTGDDIPLDSTVQSEVPASQPNSELNQIGDDSILGPVISFKRDGNPTGGIKYDPKTKTYNFVDEFGNKPATPKPAPASQNVVVVGGGGGPVPAIVQSGSGASYQVDFYPAGFTQAVGTTNVSATVADIDAGETIPAGTKVFVTQAGTIYYILIPLWLNA